MFKKISTLTVTKWLLPSITILVVALSFLISAKPALAEPALVSTDGTSLDLEWSTTGPSCNWENASMIKCDGFVFGFSIEKSKEAGYAIYQLVPKGSDGSSTGSDSLTDNSRWYLHLSENKSDQAYISKSDTQAGSVSVEKITSDNQSMKKLLLASGDNADNPGGIDTIEGSIHFENDAGLHKDENGNSRYAICGLYAKDGHTCFSLLGGNGMNDPFWRVSLSDPDNKIQGIKEALFSGMDTRDDCGRDAGSLGFVLCPILTTTRTAVEKLIGADGSGKGFLVELLTIKPLDTSSELYHGWQAIRDIALGLYVLIFVIIIFGNGLGYDPYTIKRALPRLAAGTLLTWASFFIMQTLVDLSNLVGTAVPSFLAAIAQDSSIKTYNLDLDFAAGTLTIILAIVLAFAALGALLIGLAGLITRIIVIYGLVLLAPVAFVAWVLPNTESLFKKWWKNLIKVLAMFPLVTGMLAIALFFQSTSTGPESPNILKIAGSLAPLIAIILIPKTFKWGGEIFAATAGYLAGKAQGTGDKIKDMPGAAGRKAAGSVGKGVLSSERAQKAANAMASTKAGKIFGGAALQRKTQAAKSERLKAGQNLVENMNSDQIERVAKNGNFQERVAATHELMKRGEYEKLGGLVQAGGSTGKSARYAMKSYGRDGKAAGAGFIRYNDDGSINLDKTKDAIANASPEMLAADLGDKAFTDLAKNGKLLGVDVGKGLIDPQKLDLGASQSLYGKLSGEKRKHVTPTFSGAPSSTGASGSGSAGGGAGSGSGGSSGGTGTGTGGGSPSGGPHTGGGGPGSGPTGTGGRGPGPTGGGSPGGSPASGGGSPRPGGGFSGGGTFPRTPTSPPPPPAGGAPTYSTPTGAPRYTTGGVRIPPPPSSTTPPPYTGPAAPAQPAPGSGQTPPPPPPSPGGGGALPPTPSSSGTGGGGSTGNAGSPVINNITQNISTNRGANQASSAPGVPSGAVPPSVFTDVAKQFQAMRSRGGGGSTGLASLESKIGDLQQMIMREGRNSNNVKNLMRTMRLEANSLPDHEQGMAHDTLSNFEHQAGMEDSNTNLNDNPGGTP